VAKTYAGILGSLAMVVALVRGVMSAGGVEETIVQSLMALLGFGLLGLVIGGVASWIVEDAVYTQVQQEVAAHEAPRNTRSENPATR